MGEIEERLGRLCPMSGNVRGRRGRTMVRGWWRKCDCMCKCRWMVNLGRCGSMRPDGMDTNCCVNLLSNAEL